MKLASKQGLRIMNISDLVAELGVVKQSIEGISTKALEEEARQRSNFLDDSQLQEYVARYIENRHLRLKIVATDLFSDPYWDILVDLYFSKMIHRKVNICSAIMSGNVPLTTGLRVVETLITKGLVFREKDQCDKRKSFLQLSDEGFALLHKYFARVSRSGANSMLVRRPDRQEIS